jgi:hypothetical protein
VLDNPINLIILVIGLAILLGLIASVVHIVREYERLVVFFFGRLQGARGPGIVLLVPFVQQSVRVDLRERFLEVPQHPGAEAGVRRLLGLAEIALGVVEVLRELHGAAVGCFDLPARLFERVIQSVQMRMHLVAVVSAHCSRKERALVGHGADLQCRDLVRRGSGSPLGRRLYGSSGAQDTCLVRLWILRERMQSTKCVEYSPLPATPRFTVAVPAHPVKEG